MSEAPARAPRILFLTSALGFGGAERHLSLLAPMLRERGFDPAVVTLRAAGPFFDLLVEQGIWTRFLPVRSRFDLPGIRRAVAAIGSWPDLIVSQEVQTQVVGVLAARRAGAVHVTLHHKQPELRLSWHRRVLTRLIARRIDAVIAVSAAQIPDLVSLGFPGARIEVIENGVGEPRPARTRAEVRAELGLGEGDFVALLVATLRPEKRPEVFVQAVAHAHRSDPRIHGVVAGDGPELAEVRRRAEATDAVVALGPRGDVPDLMQAADVVCLTSRAEALPMVILEAMALGRPVIATAVGGIAETVLDGQTGVVTPVDDGGALTRALLALADDSAALEAMAAAARHRYEEHYSAAFMADRYAGLLRRALSGAPRRR